MATKPLCSIPNCDNPSDRRGWCSSHYYRWHRHGDPLAGGPVKTPAGTLLNFIETVALLWESDECLVWPFTGNNKGYGQVRYGGRRRIASHLVCDLAHGPKPTPDHECAHSCGNGHGGCINPHHLSWKTRLGNAQDRDMHGTTARGERCGKDKLTEANVRAIRAIGHSRSMRSVAAEYGVSNTMIRYILTRDSWAWLD